MAEEPHGHHETSDISVGGVFAFAVGLVVVAVAIHVIVWALFRYFNARESAQAAPIYPLAVGLSNRQPPEPRLQTNPREDLRALREHEDDLLTRYRWVDRQAGIVRIPIDQAIKITAARGLPARQAPPRGENVREHPDAR